MIEQEAKYRTKKHTMTKNWKFLLAGAVALTLTNQPALAADSGGSDTPNCINGKVWDKKQKKCVEKSSAIDDDSLYEAGRKLAKAERYEEAIEVLMLVKDRNQPRVLNYLGYANRKAGRLETGLSYYRMAIAIDPDYVLARSYMGAALAESGDRKGAFEQLAEIREREGTTGEAYILLATAILGDNTY